MAYDAEMLIYHQTKEGENAVLSVFMDSGDNIIGLTRKAQENKPDMLSVDNIQIEVHEDSLLDSFQFDTWPTEEGQSVCVDSKINLMKIYMAANDENATVDRDDVRYKNFYYYKGSFSEPACYEDVHRFVMTTPIVVPSA